MKSNKSYIITYLFALIGGILLCIFHSRTNIFDWIIIIIGELFLIPSILSIVSYFLPRKKGQAIRKTNWVTLIPAIGGVIFGALLMTMPETFTTSLIITFGIVLIICGLAQLFFMMSGMNSLKISPFYLIVPSLTLLSGIFILIIGPSQIGSYVTLLTGIVLICYAANGFIGYFHKESRYRQAQILMPPISPINRQDKDKAGEEEPKESKPTATHKSAYLSE